MALPARIESMPCVIFRRVSAGDWSSKGLLFIVF
jgi:hypothetical protein